MNLEYLIQICDHDRADRWTVDELSCCEVFLAAGAAVVTASRLLLMTHLHSPVYQSLPADAPAATCLPSRLISPPASAFIDKKKKRRGPPGASARRAGGDLASCSYTGGGV